MVRDPLLDEWASHFLTSVEKSYRECAVMLKEAVATYKVIKSGKTLPVAMRKRFEAWKRIRGK
jgi:hypothetical protein